MCFLCFNKYKVKRVIVENGVVENGPFWESLGPSSMK